MQSAFPRKSLPDGSFEFYKLPLMPKIELQIIRDANALKELDADTYTGWGEGLTPQQYRVREMILRETAQCRRAWRIFGTFAGERRLASAEVFSLPFVHKGLRHVAWAIGRIHVHDVKARRSYMEDLLREIVRKAKSERISMLLAYPSHAEAPLFKSNFRFEARPFQFIQTKTPTEPVKWPAGVVQVDEKSPLNQRAGEEIAFIIDEALTFWHRAQNHLYARVYDFRDSDVSGARLRGSYVLWTTDLRNSSLRLLYRSKGLPEVTSRLIAAAYSQAQRYGLAHIEWWAAPEESNFYGGEAILPPCQVMALSLDPQIPLEMLSLYDSVLWMH